ncbi:hypothetical protein K9O30_03445 [Clostridium bowmanii]|uniref:hypothetical protein n=1 Tax=Clostridium bowmanii TaxID=132925 RepID=UPI001CD67A94|nr:hypothetical protein [Clostridium bowmanii]MCA1072802.1 hypothetical protein [Clostridium bowmanii]
MSNIEFIKPKTLVKVNPGWEISENTKAIVKYYAEYTDYTESEVIDKFLNNLLKDQGFINWANKKRNNKRLNALLKANSDTGNITSEDKSVE